MVLEMSGDELFVAWVITQLNMLPLKICKPHSHLAMVPISKIMDTYDTVARPQYRKFIR